MDKLEQTVKDIRARTPQREDENMTQWYARTYHLALLLIEQSKDELPMVKAVKERSIRASKRAGKPEKVMEDE